MGVWVIRLQDTGQSSSKSSGGSVGFGSSNNVGINASQSNADSAWVNQQSGITGGTVNITAKDTSLTGAVIAAVDEQGNSTDKLTLTTDTLTVADLQDSDNSKSMGMDLSLSTNTTKVGGSFNGHEKEQTTKATIGLGNVTVGGLSIEESIDQQPEFANLNRDAANSQEITKDMERGGVDISLTVDNRMLTEKGRDQIAEDILKSDMLVDTAVLAATTDRVGLLDFNEELGKTHTVYETVKTEIAKNDDLAKQLQNPDLSAADKEAMLNQLTLTVMAELGYETQGYDNKIIADKTAVGSYEDGVEGKVLGFHSDETGDAYINDANIENTEGLVNAAGHESSHEMDAQDGTHYSESDNEAYANNFGSNLASYTDLALDINGYDEGMATTNNHVGNSSDYVVGNTKEYQGLDKDEGDFLTIFVHGTYSSPSDADPDFISAVSKTFNEPVVQFDWSGKGGTAGTTTSDGAENLPESRQNAGERLADYIENYEFSEGEELNLVGHSHGGNVIKVSTQGYEGDKTIDSVYFLATPSRDDYTINMDNISDTATLVNAYDRSELIDDLGALFNGPSNDLGAFTHIEIEVESTPPLQDLVPQTRTGAYIWGELIGDHSEMDSSNSWSDINKEVNGE